MLDSATFSSYRVLQYGGRLSDVRIRGIGLVAWLIVATFSGGVFAAHGIDGFRGHAWGTPWSTVIELEGTPDYRDMDSGMLGYENRTVGPYNALALFLFDDDDRLIAGVYSIKESHGIHSDRYLRDFRDLTRRLTRLYGSPYITEEDWISEPVEPSGRAVVAGDLILRTGWQSHSGTILHQLSKPAPGEFMADHTILYRSISLGTIEEHLRMLDTGGL